jgi:hypothetical protein
MDGPMSTYRIVVSREDPWWVATAYGEGLPGHGAATETRTIAGLEDTVRDLIALRTDADLRMPYELAVRGFDLEWSYDLPTEAAEALADYYRSKADLDRAQARYADNAQRAASVLSTDVRASVRDVARLMGISYQRVAQLLSQFRQSMSSR